MFFNYLHYEHFNYFHLISHPPSPSECFPFCPTGRADQIHLLPLHDVILYCMAYFWFLYCKNKIKNNFLLTIPNSCSHNNNKTDSLRTLPPRPHFGNCFFIDSRYPSPLYGRRLCTFSIQFIRGADRIFTMEQYQRGPYKKV